MKKKTLGVDFVPFEDKSGNKKDKVQNIIMSKTTEEEYLKI